MDDIESWLPDLTSIPLDVLLDPPPELREVLDRAIARLLEQAAEPYDGCC